MAGGTWKIIVEEGKLSKPTQSTVVAGKPVSPKPKLNTDENIQATKKANQSIQSSLLMGVAVSRAAFNQYYSITGQNAQRNQMNAILGYGAGVASIGIQLAKGNLVGAAVATIGTGLAFGNQYINFQRNVTDQNAMAEYLRQQSGTSVNANRGELYSFRLF